MINLRNLKSIQRGPKFRQSLKPAPFENKTFPMRHKKSGMTEKKVISILVKRSILHPSVVPWSLVQKPPPPVLPRVPKM